MGLDMFLSKKTYIKNNTLNPPTQQTNIIITENNKPVDYINTKRITYIEEEVLYWRKANQIHAWFVKNVQNGEDDCKPYELGRKELEDLLKLINKTLLIPSSITRAKKFLPTSEGFFFGDTEYNKEYYNDLKRTKQELEAILKEPDNNSHFIYQSSW